MLEHGAEVRAVVRGFAGAARLARFPVTVLRGDVTSAPDLAVAIQGCDLVFHCAYGTSGSQKHRARSTARGRGGCSRRRGRSAPRASSTSAR